MNLNIIDKHSGLSDTIKNNTKKKIAIFLFNIIQLLYKNNFIFFKFSIKNLSYKEMYLFLRDHSTENEKFLFKDSFSHVDVITMFILFLEKKFESSDRFEFCLCFYDDQEETFAVNCLLCLKVFGLDSSFNITSYLDWLFKSLLQYKSVVYFLSLEDIKLFYDHNIFTKKFLLLYNNATVFNNNYLLFNVSYMYNFFFHYLHYLDLGSCIHPTGYNNCFNYPSSLSSIDEKTPLSIINLISIYLSLNNCFLDVNSLRIYKKVLGSKSTVFLYSSLDNIKKNFISILFSLKKINHKEFLYEFEFYNNPFPLFSFFIDINDYPLIDSAFCLLENKPLLVQSVNFLELDVIEYLNGFYSIKDNFFYSYTYLNKFQPDNEFKFDSIIAYEFQKKKFIKNFFLKHEFYIFLKTTFPKSSFIFFFNLFFKIPVESNSNFQIHIIRLSKENKFILFTFLKTIYNNFSFVFNNYTWLNTQLTTNKNFRFISTMPLFIFEESINSYFLNILNNFIMVTDNKPSSVFLIIDSSAELDEQSIFSNLLFQSNIIDLEDSCYSHFFSFFKKYLFSFDLFIIMNIHYFQLNKFKSKKKFIKSYRLKSRYGDDSLQYEDSYF